MMKITLLAMAALALAAAQDDPATAAPTARAPLAKSLGNEVIIKQDFEKNLTGYSFDFEISDGQSRQEDADFSNDTEGHVPVVRGSYKYKSPEGQEVSVTYLADKDGFQPKALTEENSKAVPPPAA